MGHQGVAILGIDRPAVFLGEIAFPLPHQKVRDPARRLPFEPLRAGVKNEEPPVRPDEVDERQAVEGRVLRFLDAEGEIADRAGHREAGDEG